MMGIERSDASETNYLINMSFLGKLSFSLVSPQTELQKN